jgi:hypothetical protein
VTASDWVPYVQLASGLFAGIGLFFAGYQTLRSRRTTDLQTLQKFSDDANEREAALAEAEGAQARRHAFNEFLNFLELYACAHNKGLINGRAINEIVRHKLEDSYIELDAAREWHPHIAAALDRSTTLIELSKFVSRYSQEIVVRKAERDRHHLGDEVRVAGAKSVLKITRITLPKEKMQELTAGERSLFLLLGYASNQINALWKLVIVATNEGTKDPVEEKVSAAQTQIFVRLLIGIMREALKLIEKRFLQSTLGKEYVPRLSTQAADALNRLKKRFGAPDKFVEVRDNFAFHHPSLDDMEAAFQLAVKSDGDDTDWCMYLNEGLLNTFFFASDFVLVHGMANALGETDVNEAHRKLLGDIAPIANDLSTFAFGFAEAIFIKNFGELTATRVAEIKDPPNIEDLRLPWFVDTMSFLPNGAPPDANSA